MVGNRRSLLHSKTPNNQTTTWYVNYSRSHTDDQPVETELAYLKFFAEQALKLGIKLEILTYGLGKKDIEAQLKQAQFSHLNYHIVVSKEPVLKWAEDSAEYFKDGTIAVPIVCERVALIEAMTKARRARWAGHITPEILEQVLADDHQWIPLGVNVNEAKMVQQVCTAAAIRKQKVCFLGAYIEGGNMIVGEDSAGSTIVLIGKDSLDATTSIKNMTINQLIEQLIQDFQLDNPAQIIPVEQPGQFHLDMGILFLGKGIVVVNDSSEPLRNAKEMAELAPCCTTEAMASLLQLQCNLENTASDDLKKAGLIVKRESLANGVFHNFCNGEFVTTQENKRYYITNGASSDLQEHFQQLMIKEWQVVDDVIFTPEQLSYKSLRERGGIGCRIKGASEIIGGV